MPKKRLKFVATSGDDLLSRVRRAKPGRGTGSSAAYLPLRVPPEVKEELTRAAESQGVTLNEYMQDLVLAKANGAATPDAIEAERGQGAERKIRHELLSSVASAGDIRRSLVGLRNLSRALHADAERALRAGRYSFWRGEPTEETKKIIDALSVAIADLGRHVAEARAAILAARPGKSSHKTMYDSFWKQ